MEPKNPVRILLVDDSTVFLKAATALLNSVAGVQVVGHATSAKEGLTQAKLLRPDLMLIDMVMPGMSGIEAIKLIKQGAAAPKTILVTLFNGESYRAAARTAGADGFIVKDELVAELPLLLDSLFPGWRACALGGGKP